MKTIYIAGPFRDKDSWLIELNIRRAEMISYQIASMGGVPLCPHTMYRFFNGTQTDEFWIKATKELLLRADAIVLLTDWQRSEGSQGERNIALEKGFPIFYENNMDFLYRWLKED